MTHDQQRCGSVFVCYQIPIKYFLWLKLQKPKLNTTNLLKYVARLIPFYYDTQQKCATFDELSTCIVTKLEGCDTPTPSNMAESLFRFVRKGSPCNKENKD